MGFRGLEDDQMQSALVMLDLDQFGMIIKEVGWSEYKPNRVTGYLSNLVTNLLSKHHGTHIQGLDNQRGTEEAILFFSAPDLEELLDDLESLKMKIHLLGKELALPITISIGMSVGSPPFIRLRDFRDLTQTLLFKSAKKALKMAKKRGGNQIITY